MVSSSCDLKWSYLKIWSEFLKLLTFEFSFSNIKLLIKFHLFFHYMSFVTDKVFLEIYLEPFIFHRLVFFSKHKVFHVPSFSLISFLYISEFFPIEFHENFSE